MLYKCNEEKLRFTLKNVSVLLKPSASVVGCNWVCETVTYLETMNTKKRPVEIHNGEEVTVELKPNDVCDRTLRLTVYDARRRHVKNPIGHVIFPLREARNLDKMNSYAKKLTFYSQVGLTSLYCNSYLLFKGIKPWLSTLRNELSQNVVEFPVVKPRITQIFAMYHVFVFKRSTFFYSNLCNSKTSIIRTI